MADNLLNLLKPVYTPPLGSQGPLVSCAARTMGVLAIIFGGLAALAAPCLATDVRVVGVTPGQSADLVIGDGTPVTIHVGETIEGVKLLRASLAGAVVSEEGITETLPLVTDGSSEQAAPSDTVRLSADTDGQFLTRGAVNGRPVNFIVDTGATLLALSRPEATRIGVDYSGGRPAKVQTASGEAHGWRVSLASVCVGEVTVRDVDAIVIDGDAPRVGLLGMSFLNRFDMHRQGSALLLRRR
jgi:aspartyl protease family protein